MCKGDSSDACAGKFPLVSIGERADPSSVRRRGARTPIGATGNLNIEMRIWSNLCDIFWEEIVALELTIRDKFHIFQKIFIPVPSIDT